MAGFFVFIITASRPFFQSLLSNFFSVNQLGRQTASEGFTPVTGKEKTGGRQGLITGLITGLIP
jgi:hypothetical protein